MCKKGYVYFLSGSNGCGKSTIARLATGLILPDNGIVSVSGIKTSDENVRIHQKIGMIFQNPDNQIVGTTVEEDLAFSLENMQVERDNMVEMVVDAAKNIGLESYLKSPVHHLSGGQKQMLCIASAMISKPECLIFDEPTSHLDPWARIHFFKTLNNLCKEQNIAVVLISQIAADMEHSDHVVGLENGRVIFNDSKSVLKNTLSMHERLVIPQSWKLEKMLKKIDKNES